MTILSPEEIVQRIKNGEPLNEISLDGINLQGCDLSGGLFQEVSLRGANLQNANLHETLFT